LKAAIGRHEAYAWELDDLLRALFKTQPVVMLNELVVGTDKDRWKSIEIVRETARHRQNPVSLVPDDVMLAWCAADPATRYPFAASLVLLFARPSDKEPHEWRPIVKPLLERAPDPAAVFNAVSGRLWPTSFSGSIASKYESRLQLLDRLEIGKDPQASRSVRGRAG